MRESLKESLTWQKSRWVFRATSFDDTHFGIALNVVAASERMYDAAVELGLFPSAALTPTPAPAPNCGYSFAYLDHPELSEEIKLTWTRPFRGSVVFSQAYGENRFCGQEIVGFGAMETAIKVTLESDALPDIPELGTLMSAVLDTLPSGYDPTLDRGSSSTLLPETPRRGPTSRCTPSRRCAISNSRAQSSWRPWATGPSRPLLTTPTTPYSHT